MLPFEIISTEELIKINTHHPIQHQEQHHHQNSEINHIDQKPFSPWNHFSSSSSSIQSKKDVMDDKTAEKLLSYIENHSRSSTRSHSRSRNKTSGLPSHMAQSLPEPSNKSNLSSSVANFFGIITKDMVKTMTKDDFIDYGLKIRKLLKRKIAISDMKKAGILNTFDDLLDMSFTLSDLTYDRKLFKVDQLYMLFQVDYRHLVQCKRLEFDVYTLAEAKFDSLELQGLSFSFDDFIDRSLMSKRHFEYALSYSLEECIHNGLSYDGIKKLRITRKDIRKYGGRDHKGHPIGWSEEEFDNLKPINHK